MSIPPTPEMPALKHEINSVESYTQLPCAIRRYCCIIIVIITWVHIMLLHRHIYTCNHMTIPITWLSQSYPKSLYKLCHTIILSYLLSIINRCHMIILSYRQSLYVYVIHLNHTMKVYSYMTIQWYTYYFGDYWPILLTFNLMTCTFIATAI